MGSKNEMETPKKGLGLKNGLIIICVGLLLIGALAYFLNGYALGSTELPTKHYEGFFVDINGDGLLDYVKSAEIIVNTGGQVPLPNP